LSQVGGKYITWRFFYVYEGQGFPMPELTTKIREHRKQIKLKQSELADMVGVRRETIFRLENGLYNPSLKLAMDIAKIFEVPVEELFFFDVEGM